jgi:hypothetical protein
LQPPLLETTFDQEVITGNQVTCRGQETNILRSETRHSFDPHGLSKALNEMIDPAKNVGFAQGILYRDSGDYLFRFKFL